MSKIKRVVSKMNVITEIVFNLFSVIFTLSLHTWTKLKYIVSIIILLYIIVF